MRPTHLRIVATLALLWQCLAVADYLLTVFRVTAYLGLFTPEIVRYIADIPGPWIGVWAVAVWFGLGGVILMLDNRRFAALALGVSAAAMTAFSVWLVWLSDPPMRSVAGWAGDAVMLGASLIAIALWAYGRAMHRAGFLR